MGPGGSGTGLKSYVAKAISSEGLNILELTSFPGGATAAIFGASGGIGAALRELLARSGQFATLMPFSRSGERRFDLLDEDSIIAAFDEIGRAGTLRLVIDATGFLHDERQGPEKSLRDVRPDALARAFALNAIGPAMLMKHALPLLPRDGKAVFATLSARVGSIGDNRHGGWYAYRASKAALNQLLVTAAIELQRRRPEAICLALHPGTVDTSLSQPFAKDGLDLQSPLDAARRLLDVIDKATPQQTGSFLDHHGIPIPW